MLAQLTDSPYITALLTERNTSVRISITTLGCKVNQYETSAIEQMLIKRGHEICPAGSGGMNAVIINTCAVTAESGRKSRQAIRRAKKDNPGAIIAVCGCFSQIDPEQVEKLGVDLVCGSGKRSSFVEDFERTISERIIARRSVTPSDPGSAKMRDIDNPFKRREFEVLPSGGLSGRTRAFLKIQDGCDNFCTYCIIPYARGAVRSMASSEAVNQIKKLAAEGYLEVVITGIEIASYGKDLNDGVGLLQLIGLVSQAAPSIRLRLGSIEPRLITEEFCRGISEISRLCPHFHLSLQSGSDEVLARMGRKYNTSRFYQSTELLRHYFPGCAITSDLIVGFPGETEREFNESMDFIQECRFSDMHIFPYSVRPGTRAAEMNGHLDKKTKAERAETAGAIASSMKLEYLASCVGSVQEVLIESKNGGASGHAGNYCSVSVPGAICGELIKVLISGVSDEFLLGEKLSSV